MSKPTQIYIDDSGNIHISHQCEKCSEWTRTDEYCGNTRPDGTTEFLCESCYVPDPRGNFKTPECYDQKYIHDWLIFVDDANPLECRIAIHKDVVNPDRIDAADCSMPEPEDDMSWFGPGTLASSVHAFEDLHTDVCHVWLLVDEGFITWHGASKIFNLKGGAK
jgi:hypothetical protein